MCPQFHFIEQNFDFSPKFLLFFKVIILDEEEYEDEDDEEETDSQEITGISGPAAGLLLSELLACRELEDLEGEEEDDVKNDPLHSINICDHIGTTVKGLAGVKIIQVLCDKVKKIFFDIL